MFPFSTVVECPEDQMLAKIGPTLVCTGITNNETLINDLTDATHIDRLNIGPIPTDQLNWLQPHEGSIIDFLFRSRAYQIAEHWMPVADLGHCASGFQRSGGLARRASC